MKPPTITDPSDLVGTTITHKGRQLRVAAYQRAPQPTPHNKTAQPIYLVHEPDRKPPYQNWEAILVSDVEAERNGNGSKS